MKHRPLPDVIFFPSVSTHHLLGLVPLLYLRARRNSTKFLLFFPSTPIQYDAVRRQAIPKPDPAAKVFPVLVKSLEPLVKRGSVILGTETRAMGEALQRICKTHFDYLPHPVCFNSRHEPAVARDGSRILLGCYGNTRHEKGSDLLQDAIHLYLKDQLDPNAHFVIQWLEDFHDETGRCITRDSFLESHPQVAYIRDYFDTDGGYLRQVAATDIDKPLPCLLKGRGKTRRARDWIQT
jgi:hypothetical protein